MAVQIGFSLPEGQNSTLLIQLAPPVSISGWLIRFDLMYRQNSPQPIVSKYLASGYINGESGCTLVDGANGIFQVSLYPSEVSGVSTDRNVLAFRTLRQDSGNATPINGGYRLLPPF